MSRGDVAAEGGTYTLLVQLDETADLTVGALGEREFPAGWYAYTGSALGAGGFARVDRHRAVAAGERDTRHWHVDSLLGHTAASIDLVSCSGRLDVECAVAARIERTVAEPVPGFGASDCGCDSHLAFAPDRRDLEASIRAAHDAAGE